MRPFKVIVAGAGLGGLCLAQALRRSGIDVEIFERDRGLWDRPQGYRLHIDADGVNAIAAAVSPKLFALFAATSMKPLPFTTIVDTGFAVVRRAPSDHGDSDAARQRSLHMNVDRAQFESGRMIRGDVLVGADGIHSAVRRQRLPQARLQDTKVCAIYGRIAAGQAREILPEQVLSDVFTVAVDERKVFLGTRLMGQEPLTAGERSSD